MIVLHGSWIIEPSRFYFWAERPAPGPKRKGKRPPLPPHPFAAPAEELTPALRALFGETFRPEALATVEAWLPSAGEQPLPSPELLHLNPDLAPDEDAAALARFGVPAWAVVPLDALDALLALPDPASAARAGATLGADVRFWSAAAKLTVAMLAGQRYLPGMAPVSDTRYRAVWQAVTDEPPEASQISALVAAMPPVCRALRVETGRKAGRAPMPATGGMGAAAAEAGTETLHGPRTLLGSFMGTVIDRAVRAWSGKPRRPINAAIPSSAGEAWLGALYAEDPTFGGTKSALTELYDAWRTWLEGLHAAGGLGFRICFRLETPEMAVAAKQSAWGLRYFLQATDDLSLLVPATEVWQSAGASLSYFNRRFEQPQERMLAGLGLAGRLCPPVEASLRQRQPEAAQLTTDEAYHFLREVAPLLETSGFGVLVPPWWGKRGAASFTSRLKLKPKRKAAGAAGAAPGKLTFDTLVAFDWELAMGGQPISREEFERLAAMKTPLVQVRGEWVVMDPDAIERGIRFWEDRRNHGDATLLEALRMALDAQNAAGLPVEGVEATDWVQELLSELAAGEKMPELPAPPGFTGQLRPYQGRGVSWMWFLRRFGLGACLADDMGLGKCLAPDSLVAVNGALRTVEALWESSARQIQFDGEGFWAIPSERLVVHALDEVTGQIVMTPIRRLYRQHVQEQLRMVRLEDGSSVTITRRHQLLTSNGWTNDLQVGDYVCVPAQMPWVGQAEDPDLVKFLAWQIAEGHEDRKQASLAVSQKDTAVLEELLQTLHRIGQPVYVNGTQQFSRASLEQVLAGFNRVLSGEAERDYRQLKQ